MARRASEPRLLLALERRAIGDIEATFQLLLRSWEVELRAHSLPDGTLPRIPDVGLPAQFEQDVTHALSIANGWGAAAGWWFARWRSISARGGTKAHFDDKRRTREREALEEARQLIEIGYLNGAVRGVVDGTVDAHMPRGASAWFRQYDFDVHRKWPLDLRKAAAELLTERWEDGYTVKGAMADLARLLRGVPPTGSNPVGWLETVVRTNMANMAQAGRYLAYAGDKELTGYEWVAILDSRVCPICSPLDGKVVSKAAGNGGGFAPPMHYSCRCSLVPVYSFDDRPAQGAGELKADIRSFMDDLEKSGSFGDLGAKSANTAWRRFEDLQLEGFGGRRVWADMKAAGVL